MADEWEEQEEEEASVKEEEEAASVKKEEEEAASVKKEEEAASVKKEGEASVKKEEEASVEEEEEEASVKEEEVEVEVEVEVLPTILKVIVGETKKSSLKVIDSPSCPAGVNDEEPDARPRVTYVPPPLAEDEDTIFSHYQSGINFDKYDDILVDVGGTNPPPAIFTFEEAGFCESLKRNVAKSGYVKPTPVQKHCIPIIAAGRDLMACAQTGSGKTNLRASSRVIRDLMKGCNVLCGTPGRVMDMIGRGKVSLAKIQFFVLDEADRMLDMGFEPDMRKLMGLAGMPAKEDRQTLMFSATYPESIQRLAGDFLKKDYLFLAVGVVGGACSDVAQKLIQVTKFAKREQLLDILKQSGQERTLVFVETKRQADFIACFLCQEEVPTTSIHGGREQREREQALGDFRSGKCPVLVATSVAARGLDIKDVQNVVNYDLPVNIDEYVHRIGRTGRCGNTGRAVSFYDPDADHQLARSMVKILSIAQQEVPPWLEEAALGAHSTTSFNPQERVFASTDSRRGGGGGSSGHNPPAAQSAAAAADDEWE
ncbi:hypothetical protein NHX12_015015 [Muraenolepis orangiensis]|uniref:RNA helicase n=1 Tax=Muraenolepis orangiensis TaxID=630683 RepID=A0A9Q0D9N2_9TELE|nr:hypothetical protein NHX12_015015 [Muraenolepis orangiensis]